MFLLRLAVLVTLTVAPSDGMLTQTCSSGWSSAVIQPDAQAMMIGLLAHSQTADGRLCDMSDTNNMQAYEAMRWALQRINQDTGKIGNLTITDSYVPGIKIGMKVFDTCGQESVAAQHLLRTLPQLAASTRYCAQNDSQITLGVIGPTYSDAASSIATLLADSRISQMTYSANVAPPSGSTEFPNVLRTVPSDELQVKVIIGVLKALNWTNVAVVYTQDSYGVEGRKALLMQAAENDICVATSIALSAYQNDDESLKGVYRGVLKAGTAGVVFFGRPAVARSILRKAVSVVNSGKLQWIFADSVGKDSDIAKNIRIGIGMITVTPTSVQIPEFAEYWSKLDENSPSGENPWYQKWYMTENRCRLQNINYSPFNRYSPCQTRSQTEKQNNYIQHHHVEKVIVSLFTYARALRNAQRALCGGNQARGMCQNLKNLNPRVFHNTYLKNVDFTFTDNDRIPSLASARKAVKFASNSLASPAYSVWQLTRASTYRQVGLYEKGDFILNLGSLQFYDIHRDQAVRGVPESACVDPGCAGCLVAPKVLRHAYVGGDVSIAGVVSVHQRGKSLASCGKIDTAQGAQYAQAFLYAVQKLRNYLPNIKIGGLLIDDCGSHITAGNTVASFQSGANKLKAKDGEAIKPSLIQAYVAAQTTKSTIAVGEAVVDFDIPLIGYKISNRELSTRLPGFIRMNPSDTTRAKALALLLRGGDWRFIQTVVSNEHDAHTKYLAFKEIATKEGICIAATHTLSGSNVKSVVKDLSKSPRARAVVVFLSHNELMTFLNAFKNSAMTQNFLLIGDETFHDYGRSVQDVAASFGNFVTLKLKTPSLNAFQESLKQIKPATYTENPWFKEWYEAVFECYLDEKNTNSFSKKCNTSNSIISAKDFQINQNTLAVMNSVYAVARGLDLTIKHYCGQTSNTLCEAFSTANDKGSRLGRFIRNASFVDEVSNSFQFTEDGESPYGYEILNMKNGKFIKIGGYTSLGEKFTLDKSKFNFAGVTSHCAGVCTECLYLYRSQKHVYLPGDVILGGLFDIHKQGSSPLSCGVISGHETLYADAMAFAINNVNEGKAPVSVRNIKLGGLLLDSCSDDMRVSTVLSGLHSGLVNIGNREGMSNIKVPIGWLTYGDRQSIAAADVIRSFGLPQISPSATTQMLSDKAKYPTFFRTLPGADKLVAAMVAFIKNMGWRYVQTLHSSDHYGQSNFEMFKMMSSSKEICILHSHILPSDGSYTNTISKMAAASTDVVIMFVSESQIRNFLLEVKSMDKSFVFVASDSWRDSYQIINGTGKVSQNAVTFGLKFSEIDSFNEYITAKYRGGHGTNPWTDEYYQSVYRCDLDPNKNSYGVKCGVRGDITQTTDYMQNYVVSTTIDAVYSFAKAVDLLLIERCGQNYVNVCADFGRDTKLYHSLIQKLNEVSFSDTNGGTFAFQNKERDIGYNINRCDNGVYKKIGTYKGGSLVISNPDLRSFYADIKTECPGNCPQCLAVSRRAEDFIYIPGDVILTGIFDVHLQGGDPFSCSKINMENGFLLSEAFSFAIEYVNNKTGIFKGKLGGVTIGGIGLDACQSPVRASNLISNVHSGVLPLIKQGKSVDPARTMGYIGGFSSQQSFEIADVLNTLTLPQISYGSTDIELSDRKKYPYFLRTVPADDKQARAIISILKKFNQQYVQVIYSPGIYGEQSALQFTKLATDNTICVAQKISFGTTTKAAYVVRDLLKKSQAKTVILFVRRRYIHDLLKALTSANVSDKFMLIGSSDWANHNSVLGGGSMINENSITIGVETADIPDFDKYMESKNPNNYKRNPWFSEYYENVFECSLNSGSRIFDKQCQPQKNNIVYAKNYKQDPFLLYTVDAVFSAALGLHKALQNLCGENYMGLCEAFRTSGEKRQKILNGIKAAQFIDTTKRSFGFTEDGESTRGYHIYSIERSRGSRNSYYYKNVGSFNDTHQLKVDSAFDLTWQSSCTSDESCSECPAIRKQMSTHMAVRTSTSVPESNTVNIVALLDIHKRGKDLYTCGELNIGTSFQNLLAFIYTLENINSNVGIALPASIKFNGMVFDTCSSKIRTQHSIFNYISGNGVGMNDDKKTIFSPSKTMSFVTEDGLNTVVANDLLAPLKRTVISVDATMDTLNDQPYLLRISPPDNLQASAMLGLAKFLNVKYVAAVSSTSGNFGIRAFLKKLKSDASMCLASEFTLSESDGLPAAKNILNSFSSTSGLKVIFLFTTPAHTRLLLQATRELNLIGRFQWIVSSPWSDNGAVAGHEEAAAGALSLQIRSEKVESYLNFVKSLDFASAKEKGIPNDWFEEFWQHTLKCRLMNSSNPINKYTQICKSDGRITDTMVRYSGSVFNTLIATYITAQGVLNLKECKSATDIYVCLLQKNSNIQSIYDAIKTSQWTVLPDQLKTNSFNFKFTNTGYGDVGYYINSFMKDGNSYRYERVGQWNKALEMKKGFSINITSTCRTGDKCDCVNGQNVTAHTDKPNVQALVSPPDNDNFTQIWGIIVTILSALGIILTVTLFIYFLIFYPVRSGTSVLGFILLLGILCTYVLNFAFIMHANEIVCAVRQFCLGLVYAIVFVCMFMKAVNTWRVGAYSDGVVQTYHRLSHPCSFLLMALGMILVQVIIGVEWLALQPPAFAFVPVDDTMYPRCVPVDFHSQELILSCIYVMFLILLTLIFSALTFNREENNRESRWILTSCCFTIGIWLVWTVISTLTSVQYRDPSIAVANLINATIILLCMFVRKLYLLNKYQKEVDEEEERKSHYSVNPSHKGEGRDNDAYSTVYGEHAYDNNTDGVTLERRNSRTGSGIMYVYSGRKDDQMHY